MDKVNLQLLSKVLAVTQILSFAKFAASSDGVAYSSPTRDSILWTRESNWIRGLMTRN